MMDVKKKIQILRACSRKKGERCSSCPAFGQGSRNCMKNTMKDAADALEKLQAELNAAKSPEVLEAVDELIEFARTRMGIAEWLYYVDVLGGWRGQKEG